MIVQTYQDILRLGLSRRAALAFACPKCGALPGASCGGRRKPPQKRVSPHIERYDAAARVLRPDHVWNAERDAMDQEQRKARQQQTFGR